MILGNRSVNILQQIIQAEGYVSINQLIDVIRVSKRTIYYDIKKIEDWLEEEGLHSIEYIRPLGYCLNNETKQIIVKKLNEFTSDQYEYSPQERKIWLILCLLIKENRILLEDLIDLLQVSRNTVLTDLKKLKVELNKYDLLLQFGRKQGYQIAGDEQDKRNLLISSLSHIISKNGWEYLISQVKCIITDMRNEKDTLERETLYNIKNILSNCEEFLGIQYTDEVLENLSVYMYLFHRRILKGQYIEMEEAEKNVLRDSKQFEAAKYIAKQFERKFAVKFPSDEIYYITTHLLGAKVNYQENMYEKNNKDEIHLVVDRMIKEFQDYACVIFEDFNGLSSDLYLHMKPAFYRVKYGIDIENPLLNTIQQNYKEVYCLTKKVIHHFEEYVRKSVSDDEIAYITMHFGAWMRKEGIVPNPRKTALLVCPNGIGTSRMLQYQLEKLFSNVDILNAISKREYESNTFDVDCIITTTEIEKRGVPVFKVNPILTDSEKASLLRNVNGVLYGENQKDSVDVVMGIIRKYSDVVDEQSLKRELTEFMSGPVYFEKEEKYKPMLNELLTKEFIQLQNRVDNWKDAIKVAAEPLLQNQYIIEEYIDEMIVNVEKLGPYIVIAPKIAIPHARPEAGVKQLGMSLLQLKESVSFSEKQEHAANLIIVLAAIDNETHLKALAQLSEMLSEQKNVEMLIQSDSKDKLLEMIAKYSN
ncbi:BglG family transcription antiterminator [Bacillus thuringiensis]|uniref:PTS lichenan transporter subunit IIC n=1 Tax=Bacillus thuringiensis TaxID=1428 RepID=A0AB36TTG8_BACTU|nr:BglG family transcription antiterminator [Bacillus thuringiensis]PEE62345.1 PTS lichenan transporter subunit IIC [Bacillus thuringiensis]PEE88383.1 PTS lichenan transporter subunit IIC [Bacillus thuringiensis]PEV91165.1 PTS lichenan transporter subunit IIC [Bacillus thuringiensis]PFK92244.1 PTS lichenan transporter subunit IIC [Bacillus thuringiensis]PFM89006.1 PTS lichenan transporter subunit IIC [Bacillus thuringiensis]